MPVQDKSADNRLRLAEQRLEAAELRVSEDKEKIKTFLESTPISKLSEGPNDDALRLRVLTIEAERIRDSLTSMQAAQNKLSSQQASGQQLNERDVAILEQTELGVTILQQELEKTDKAIAEYTQKRQRYVRLFQKYDSLQKELATSEEEREEARQAIQALKESR